jgi:molybdopterin adenylyltransferase
MMRVAILTVSDKAYRGEREDLTGPALAALVRRDGLQIVAADIVPDERELIAQWIVAHAPEADVLLTCGGTGLGPRDVTPEATRDVVRYEAPGLAEAIRTDGLTHTAHAMLSRGVAGVIGTTLVINLSGSPRAVREQYPVVAPVLSHAVELLHGHTEHAPESGDPAE